MNACSKSTLHLNTFQQGQQHNVHAEACGGGGDIVPVLDRGATLQHGGNVHVHHVLCHCFQNEHAVWGDVPVPDCAVIVISLPLHCGGEVPVHRVECQGGLNGYKWESMRICLIFTNAEKATIVNDIM